MSKGFTYKVSGDILHIRADDIFSVDGITYNPVLTPMCQRVPFIGMKCDHYKGECIVVENHWDGRDHYLACADGEMTWSGLTDQLSL